MFLTIAVANLKGGVGKSTTTVFIAETLALVNDLRVLVIDLDAQANSSFMLLSRDGVENAEATGRTLPSFFVDLDRSPNGVLPLARYVIGKASELTELHKRGKRGRVDLLPSVPALWFVELLRDKKHYLQNEEPAHELRALFTQHLQPLSAEYDLVFFDCPPGFSSLTRAGLLAADVIISPTIADAVSVRSLADFTKLGLHTVLKREKVPHYVVISKFQANETNRTEKARLQKRYNVLEPAIRYSVDMTRATERIRGDSYRSFREKYGVLEADIRSLADQVYRYVILEHRGATDG
jgi:chromosome partitioning protein